MPPTVDELVTLGQRLAATRRFQDAGTAFERAVALAPDNVEARVLLGAALVSADRPEDAVPHLERAVTQRPDNPLAHRNLGTAFQALNQPDAAVACYETALAIAPEDPLAHFNRAVSWLAQGDYDRGWPEFEWRWRCPQFFGRSLADDPRRWDGAPLAGRTLLVYAEQGYGDAIQNLRFARVIRAGGNRVVLRCGPTLAPLIREAGVTDIVVTQADPLPAFDVHAAIMSLPALLGVTLESLPRTTPYLSVAPDRRARWRGRLAHVPGRRVGICWQGNPTHPRDAQRSTDLDRFEGMAAGLETMTLLSLQHERPETAAPAGDVIWLADMCAGRFDLADAAAAMSSLDLVITVDTVNAHLAGALGVPVWILLPFAADWRWMLDRSDTPWYPSARLFRQPRRGDWNAVFETVGAELASL